MSKPNKMMLLGLSERDSALLGDLFDSEYEILNSEDPKELTYLLQDSSGCTPVILLGYKIYSDFLSFCETQPKEDKIPIILIYTENDTNDSSFLSIIKNPMISDSICLPLNTYAIKRRIENLVEYFRQKNSLEDLVRSQTEHILEQNDRLRQQQEKITNINNDMLDTLGTIIEYRDVESGKHVFRIRKFTEILLRAVAKTCPEQQLTEEKIRLISSAASMHDIGKIAIPDSILLSPKRLSYDEFNIMKSHTTKGCEILESIDNIEHNEYYTYCYQICRYHHEKWDGMGYPDGLKGDEIPLCAQVVSVADCYDALTSQRPYKEAYSHEKAVDMIRSGACGAFSGKMMECFSMVLPQFREWAERYSDGTQKSEPAAINDNQEPASADAFYVHMNRSDLIKALERQKEIGKETHERDCDIIYRISDIVFECNLKHDNFYDRKDNWSDFFKYYPKNYADAITIMMDRCHPNDKQKFLETFRAESLYDAVYLNQKKLVMNCRFRFESDEYCLVRCTVIPFWSDNEGKIRQVIFTGIFLNDDTIVQETLNSELCDDVTGLWNIDYMKNLVNDYIAHSGKNGIHAVLFLGIDNFKKINMLTGEQLYAELLTDITKSIEAKLPPDTVVAKSHSDNFIIFIKDCPDKLELISDIEYLHHALHRHYTYGDLEIPVLSMSIGIARYPYDGTSFEELAENSGCAAEYAQKNGGDIYLFYNAQMKAAWKLELYSAMIPENEPAKFVGQCDIFCPLVNVRTSEVESYNYLELPDDLNLDGSIEEIYDVSIHSEKAVLMTLMALKNQFARIKELEERGYTIPPISIYTAFTAADRNDVDKILSALLELINQSGIQSENICLFLPQNIFASLGLRDINVLIEGLHGLGLKVGVFCFGMNTINIKCLTDRLFDKVVFSENFVNDVGNGIYPIDLLVYLTEYFYKRGTSVYMPNHTHPNIINILVSKTKAVFFAHAEPHMNLEQFKAMLCGQAARPICPILEHERSEMILASDMYNEILERTLCVIFEWNPATDNVRFSESYEKIYHAKPFTKNFLFAVGTSIKIHKDDRTVFTEKLICAKEGRSPGEFLVRFRMGEQKDRFRINKIRLVPVQNETGLTTKVIGIMMVVSEDDNTPKTDRVTTLYSRHGAENRIKKFLNGEGFNEVHAFFALELMNIEEVSELLGSIFYEAVLRENALKLKEIFRDSDIIARMDGGSFIIFIKNIRKANVLFSKADTICDMLKNTYQCGDRTIDVSAYIGISIYPLDGKSYEKLYETALSALRDVKHSENRHWFMYSEADSTDLKSLI